MIERIHLLILKAIQETGTLAAASDTLCVTQSAISQSIKKLEKTFKLKVWEKQGRRIRLTHAGEYLLETAQRILPQLELADTVLHKYSSGLKGSLRIGMECHPCYRWLLQIIAPYLKAWPDVDVDILKQFVFRGLSALFQYEIDILITPDAVNQPGLIFYPVFDYEQVLVISKEHPLAHKQWIDAVDLSTETLLTYPIENARLDIYRDFMTPSKVVPKKHLHLEDTDMLLQMVASNRGVTALPRWLVEESQNQFNIQALSLGKKGIFQKIYIGIRKETKLPDYLKAFLKNAGAKLS